MSCYGATACFGKSQEVLRRGVEMVEYMNDLIDEFDGMAPGGAYDNQWAVGGGFIL